MIREIEVKAGAKKAEIKEVNGIIKVMVKEPPEKNKANRAVIKVLSQHFGKPVRIIHGLKGKKKRVMIG